LGESQAGPGKSHGQFKKRLGKHQSLTCIE
jgi:hypothetical protein